MRRALALVVLASCSAAPPGRPGEPRTAETPPPPRAIEQRPRVAAPAALAEATKRACDDLVDEQAKVARRLRVADEELQGGIGVKAPSSLGVCVAAGRGAWAVVLDPIAGRPCEGDVCALSLRVAHVDERGTVARSPATTLSFAAGVLDVPEPSVADLDGDGEGEALVRWKAGHVACGKATRAADVGSSLWSFHTDVRPFAPAAALGAWSPLFVEALVDANGDGRTDLATRGPFVTVADRPCIGGASDSIAVLGPELVAVARPDGTFALDESSARKACPSRPAAIVARPREDQADALLTTNRLVCARLWGTPEGEIAAELERHRKTICRQETGTCPLFEKLRAWASLAPPLVLR